MAIVVTQLEAASNDPTMQLIIDTLASGAKIVPFDASTLDPANAYDAYWLESLEGCQARYAKAEDDLAKAPTDALKDNAKSAMVSATTDYAETKLKYFGYAVNDKGKIYISRGSILDSVHKAVKELNKRSVWLAGDTLVIRDIDSRACKLNVYRIPVTAKRNRSMRKDYKTANGDYLATVKARNAEVLATVGEDGEIMIQNATSN